MLHKKVFENPKDVIVLKLGTHISITWNLTSIIITRGPA